MHYTIVISWAPHPLSSSSIFLLKLLVTVIYIIVLYIISMLTIILLGSLSPKTLISNLFDIQNGNMKNINSMKIWSEDPKKPQANRNSSSLSEVFLELLILRQ